MGRHLISQQADDLARSSALAPPLEEREIDPGRQRPAASTPDLDRATRSA